MLTTTRVLAAIALSGTLAGAAFAQPPVAKPGPETKALGYFAGNWKMEGTMKPSPMGPGGQFSGSEQCEWWEGGFHLVCHSQGSGPMGPMKNLAIMSYDLAAKVYTYYAVGNMPQAEYAKGTRQGGVWTFTSELDLGGGKKAQSRFTITETSPTTYAAKWELAEGGAMATLMEGKGIKVK